MFDSNTPSDQPSTTNAQKRETVNYSLKGFSLIESLCFNILNNLCCLYHKTFIEFDQIDGLFELIKTAYVIKKASESTEARLIYCLHISKSAMLIKNNKRINSINLISYEKVKSKILIDGNKNVIEYNHLLSLINKLLNNEIIKENAKSITRILTKNEPKNYEFSNTKICFFTCDIDTLRGFSGPDAIYINHDHIRSVFRELKSDLEYEFKLLFIQLEIIRIVQHELAHVVLQNSREDLNCSSPELIAKLKLSSAYPEAGLICEQKIFESRIDYVHSSQKKDVNYGYIASFIQKFLNNELKKFDFKIANVSLSKETPVLIAVDMKTETDVPIFE